MKHFIFNVSDGDRGRAAALLRSRMWEVGRDERHRDALAPGDVALIHVAGPGGGFTGRVELATGVHDRPPSETEARRGELSSAVEMADVEEWPVAVPVDVVIRRIDPTGSNPYVQANATGFRSGLVQTTRDEHDVVLALSREAGET